MNTSNGLTHESAVLARNKRNQSLLSSSKQRVKTLLSSNRISEARAHDLLDQAERQYKLHPHWDENHWPDVTWPQESLKAEVKYGHPCYRYIPLTWTQVIVKLKNGATRKGTVAQIMRPWVHCIVQLEPGLEAGCYPFRADKVTPWDKAPRPYTGTRNQSHLEVIGKEESKEQPKAKEKKVTKKKQRQQFIDSNNLFS